jgi:L-alanine-DL-glutamate epimerase-like enolase superfamily enzyme
MKITAIELGMLRVPLKTPFKTALRTVETVEDVVVLIRTDTGHVGYGEAPATPPITGDTHGSIIEAIRTSSAAPDRPGGGQPQPHVRAGAGIDGAQHQRQGRGGNRRLRPVGAAARAPLYQMLGGGDPVITTDITISVDYIDKMVADSLSAIERGFESLKIKVGKDIGLDIERVKAIHAAVDGRALLRLDANQGWTAKQAVHAMHTLEEAGVVLAAGAAGEGQPTSMA